MKVLTVKNIYNYHHAKTEKSRLTLFNKLNKTTVISESNEGRNYWHRSLTAISKSFKTDDKQFIFERIDSIMNDHAASTNRTTKLMYENNINVLKNFLNCDFSIWRPDSEIQFISQKEEKSVITVNGLQIKIHGDNLFVYKKDNHEYIGAIWFLAQKGGYKKEDLALFSDALYRLLKHNFAEQYMIETDFCMVIDASGLNTLSYAQIENKETPSKLELIINNIKSRL